MYTVFTVAFDSSGTGSGFMRRCGHFCGECMRLDRERERIVRLYGWRDKSCGPLRLLPKEKFKWRD